MRAQDICKVQSFLILYSGADCVFSFNCAVNIITDLACLLFPVFVMKSLNLPRRQRAALIFVFALGGV